MAKKRKKIHMKAARPAWTSFQNAEMPGGGPQTDPGATKHFQGVFLNSRYQVSIYRYESPWGVMDWLAIVNRDRSARHDWRDFQRIKNELCGEDREAFEMYPAEERLVDTNNQFHLFVLPKGKTFPIGFAARDVGDRQFEGSRHKQRPFEVRPDDLNANESDERGWSVFGPGTEDPEDAYDDEAAVEEVEEL